MISDDFDKQVIGMKSGDKKAFAVHFPDTYHNKKLAGLDISFEVTLKDIREQKLPALDNEFAASLGKYETVDEVKSEIRKKYQDLHMVDVTPQTQQLLALSFPSFYPSVKIKYQKIKGCKYKI